MRNRLFFCFILLIGVSFLAKAQDKKEIRKAVKQHNRAVYLKEGWIRDPYIYLCEDGFYYLTGTTPTYGDTPVKPEIPIIWDWTMFLGRWV